MFHEMEADMVEQDLAPSPNELTHRMVGKTKVGLETPKFLTSGRTMDNAPTILGILEAFAALIVRAIEEDDDAIELSALAPSQRKRARTVVTSKDVKEGKEEEEEDEEDPVVMIQVKA
jgi:hypothetical protein